MIDIFTVVMNSRRMRRFMAVYALAYFILCLTLNYVSQFFTGVIPSYIYLILSNALQSPFVYGCVRGIVTRDYRFGKGMAAYGGLTDWCIRSLQIPSFTLECGKGENPLPLEEYFCVYAALRQLFFEAPLLL